MRSCTQIERLLVLCFGIACLMVAAGLLAEHVRCVDGQNGPEFSAVETLCTTVGAAADPALVDGRGCVRINATIPDASAAPQGPYPVLRVYPVPPLDNTCAALGPADEPEPRQRQWIQTTLAAYPAGSTFACDVVEGVVYRHVDRDACIRVTALMVFLTILGMSTLIAVSGMDARDRRRHRRRRRRALGMSTPLPPYSTTMIPAAAVAVARQHHPDARARTRRLRVGPPAELPGNCGQGPPGNRHLKSISDMPLNVKELNVAAARAVEANALLTPEAKRLIAKLYTLFRHRIGGALTEGGGDVAFWSDVIADMMVTAAKFRIEGVQRKAALIEVLKMVIDSEVPADAKDVAHAVVDNVISPGIDLAIRYAKGSKGCQKMFSACC